MDFNMVINAVSQSASVCINDARPLIGHLQFQVPSGLNVYQMAALMVGVLIALSWALAANGSRRQSY